MSDSKVMFYTDPHIGLQRKAHSTIKSNATREVWALKVLEDMISQADGLGCGKIACLGDFFDRDENPESVMISALPIAKATDWILAGNHDVPNRVGKASSLQLLSHFKSGVLMPDNIHNEGYVEEVGKSVLCFAPHALNQEGYDRTIDDLVEYAKNSQLYRVLCLHCNVELPDELATGATLNVTSERLLQLLETFHYILIGHEHTPKDLYGGRVKVIGSVTPTAFDNMEDKRALVYDADTATFTELKTWDYSQGFFQGKVSDDIPEGSQKFFDLVDDGPIGDAQRLVLRLLDEGAFAVRLRRPDAEQKDEGVLETITVENLPTQIGRKLAQDRPHLVELWTTLVGECK